MSWKISLLGGDLNVTLATTEKKGGSIMRDPAREWVEDIMADWELEDVKPTKGKYMWSNKRAGPCYPQYLGITRRSCLEAHMVLDMEYRERD
jgi:hypothetical protein